MDKTKEMAMQMREQEQTFDISQQKASVGISPSAQVNNGLSALKQMDAASIDTLAKALIHEVAEGNAAEDKLFALGQKISLLGESIVNNVKGFVYAKTYCQKGDKYITDGVQLTPSAIGTKYDYASSGDPIWEEINEEFTKAKKMKDDREKFLKTIKGSMTLVDPSTGDIIEIKEPIKTGTEGYTSKVL